MLKDFQKITIFGQSFWYSENLDKVFVEID